MLLNTGHGVGNICKRSLFYQIRRYVSFLSKSVVDTAAGDGELRVFMVAGEVSGDIIGSRLISSLKKLSPLPLRVTGVGGQMMREAGLESVYPMEDISMMGLLELVPHLYRLKLKLNEAVKHAYNFRPHVVVTVDFKGFCFRFLQQLRAAYSGKDESPVHFHYVAPSFWAWKGGEERLKDLSEFVDHLFCILPHEDLICRSHGLSASFVGHPIVEDVLDSNSKLKIKGNAERFHSQFSVPNDGLTLSVLPGSRLQEVKKMLPIFSTTFKLLQKSFPDLTTAIHVAPNKLVENDITNLLENWPVPHVLVPGGNLYLKHDAFSASRAALCTSGTVALELLFAGLPFMVAYRANIVTEWFIRCKARIPFISLPNILANSPIIPEALFGKCQPSFLASVLEELITSKEVCEGQIRDAEKVGQVLLPGERVREILREHPVCDFGDFSPSLVAASSILSFKRSSHCHSTC